MTYILFRSTADTRIRQQQHPLLQDPCYPYSVSHQNSLQLLQSTLITPPLMLPLLILLFMFPLTLPSQLCVHHKETQPPLLIVSRLDGKISAVSLTPDLSLVWEVDLGHPLLAASTNMALKDDTHILPSLDGNLYSITQSNEGYHSIQPYASLESLLNQNMPGAESKWVGGKVVTTRGVSPSDGRVLYQCNIDNCQKFNDSVVGVEPMLALTDEKKTLRFLDMRRGVEEWSWSVTTVGIQYIGVKHRSSCMPPNLPLDLHFDVEGGVINALFSSGHFASIQLPGPLSQSWILNNEFLQSVNMFHSELDANEPAPLSIFLSQWQGTLYIQPFRPQDSVFRMNRINQEIFHLDSNKVGGRSGRNTISWEHPSTTAVATVQSRHSFMYNDIVGKVWRPRIDYIPPLLPTDPEIVKEEGDMYYWLQGMILTALLGIITAYGVYRKVFKRKPMLADMSTETDIDDNLSIPPSSPLLNNGVFNFDKIPPPFESRFEQDFEVIRELGQGGFGKVIEAKHKISEHNYAIKIIRLSHTDDVKKMEREVAAMAKLEHPNILRYYNSWKESPTSEWTRSRKYTHTSDSKDSGTSTKSTSPSLSWCSKSNVRTQTRCYRIQIDDDTNSDVFNRSNFIGGNDNAFDDFSSSIVFRNDDQSESIVFRNDDQSESIVFRNDDRSESNNLRSDDRSESIVFNNRNTDSSVQVVSEDSHLLVNKKCDVELSVRSDETTRTSTSRKSVTFSSIASSEWSLESPAPGRNLFLYIQMQLCSDVTLKEWLVRNKIRNEMSLTIFREIVDAVEYIHSHNHIHRDMKPSNILFGEDGRVKVADFGLATVMNTAEFSSPDFLSTNQDFKGPSLTHNLGTKLYMSPELETNSPYDYKVDIYALGIILFEMLVVFGTVMERVDLIQALRSKMSVPPSLEVSYAKYKVILLQMIACNPEDRPTAAEVKTFFSDTDCDQVDFARAEI